MNMQNQVKHERNLSRPKVNNKFPMLHKLSQRPHKKKQGIHDPNEVYMARGAMENINPLKPMPLQQIRQNQNDLEKHHNARGFSNKARKESKDGRRKPLKELNSSPYLAPLV